MVAVAGRCEGLRRPPRLAIPFSDLTPVGTYAYHEDMMGDYGDNWLGNGGGRGFLARDRWYCIEQQFKVNTPPQGWCAAPGLTDSCVRRPMSACDVPRTASSKSGWTCITVARMSWQSNCTCSSTTLSWHAKYRPDGEIGHAFRTRGARPSHASIARKGCTAVQPNAVPAELCDMFTVPSKRSSQRSPSLSSCQPGSARNRSITTITIRQTPPC